MSLITMLAKRDANRAAKSIRFSQVDQLRYALGGGLPGQWASDHWKEAERFTDWNYIAINTVMRQFRKATVNCFDDAGDAGMQREITRSRSRSRWRENPTVRATGQGYWDYGESRYRLAPKSLYQQEEAPTDPLPTSHPLVRLMQHPNPFNTGAAFRAMIAMNLCLTGMVLIWNRKNEAGKIMERYILPTPIMQPVKPSSALPMGGWRINSGLLSRFVNDLSGYVDTRGLSLVIGWTLPSEDVQVMQHPHPIYPDAGYSPTGACGTLLDVLKQIIVSHWALLQNRADPSVHLELPKEFQGGLEEIDAMLARAQAKYSGASNVGKIMATLGKATVLTHSAREMDYATSYDTYRDAVLAIHGVTALAAGVQDPTGNKGYYAPLKSFIDLTIQPQLDMVAEEDTQRVARQFGQRITIEIEASRVDDPELVEKQLATDIASGTLKVDEYRAIRGRKLWGGPEGDKIISAQQPMGGVPGSGGGANRSDATGQENGQSPLASLRDRAQGMLDGLSKSEIASVTRTNGQVL